MPLIGLLLIPRHLYNNIIVELVEEAIWLCKLDETKDDEHRLFLQIWPRLQQTRLKDAIRDD